jgi:hypothetical protein
MGGADDAMAVHGERLHTTCQWHSLA